MNSKRNRNWISAIPKADIDAAVEESFVDAYGEHEQHSGVLTMIEERIDFPFQAKVIGTEVSVAGMSWPDVDEFGLDLIIEGDDGEDYPIAAQSVEPLKPFPAGIEFLALYIQWRRQF